MKHFTTDIDTITARRVLDRPGYQLTMGAVPERETDNPPPSIVRGNCPDCGGDVVANLYWNTARGYLLRYECWDSLRPAGHCAYYAVP